MSFVRRSVRWNANHSSNQAADSNKQNSGQYSRFQSQSNFRQYPNQDQHRQQRYFQSSVTQQPKETVSQSSYAEQQQQPKEHESQAKMCAEKSVDLPQQKNTAATESVEPSISTSATTKALSQIDNEGNQMKLKWKKGSKIPLSLRRKRLNQRLSKVLSPKSALNLLHELKPHCIYKVQEHSNVNPPLFLAQVEDENDVLGTGQGLSKSQAKNTAAENAIKKIISKKMSQNSMVNNDEDSENEKIEEDSNADDLMNLPWVGLASFAMYKLFSEWQSQGTDMNFTRVPSKSKNKEGVQTSAIKKELPKNAAELHPAVLLNVMKPGITAVEVERSSGPQCRVTMGYMIDGHMYTGTSGNKKLAKMEAAKNVIASLYGLTYNS